MWVMGGRVGSEVRRIVFITRRKKRLHTGCYMKQRLSTLHTGGRDSWCRGCRIRCAQTGRIRYASRPSPGTDSTRRPLHQAIHRTHQARSGRHPHCARLPAVLARKRGCLARTDRRQDSARAVAALASPLFRILLVWVSARLAPMVPDQWCFIKKIGSL